MEQQPSKRQRTQPAACPLQLQQQQQQPGAAAGEGADEGPSSTWLLPEVVHHVASFLSGNERACTLRLVCKATAAQFRGPLDTTVRLSKPTPHHAFVRRWGSPGATRSLTVRQRAQLPSLTARSGSIANLEVLLARNDLTSPLDPAVLQAAAGAGQLETCRWLWHQGCPLTRDVLEAAAESGHMELYAWLLAEGCPRSDEGAMQKAAGGGHRAMCECLLASSSHRDLSAAPAAAHGGHVGLMDWLLARRALPAWDNEMELLESAAAGCDLPTLQRLLHGYLDTPVAELSIGQGEQIVMAAVGSPTADWRDKVEWLEGLGFPRAGRSCAEAARRLDGRERLEWLQRRGYPLTADAAAAAAQFGNVDALEFLLGQGMQLSAKEASNMAISAARGGHLAILKLLHSYCPSMDHTTVTAAAGSGHLAVVAWLAEVLGAAVALTMHVFDAAARAGSMELLAWLHEHGCPLGASALAAAADSGSEEQLDWLAERGCPMWYDGEPYRRALANADLAVLRCLRRLDCPWGLSGRMEESWTQGLVSSHSMSNPGRQKQLLLILPWLVEQGCTFSWVSMRHLARMYGDSELLALVAQLDQAPKCAIRGGRVRAPRQEKAVGKHKGCGAGAAGSTG